MIRFVKDLIAGRPVVARSPIWHIVRKVHIEKYPQCAVCGGTVKLEVHHIIPVHVDPTLELDSNNLITLCEAKKYGVNCHLLVGHGGNYQKMNERIFVTIEHLREILAKEPQ